MTGFRTQPESFPPSAGQLRSVGDQLVQQWQPVLQQTQSVRFGAGYDMVSPLVKVSLATATRMIDECVTTSAEALHGFADGLENMGRTYAEYEKANIALMGTE